jgi:hypothetical protein
MPVLSCYHCFVFSTSLVQVWGQRPAILSSFVIYLSTSRKTAEDCHKLGCQCSITFSFNLNIQ